MLAPVMLMIKAYHYAHSFNLWSFQAGKEMKTSRTISTANINIITSISNFSAQIITLIRCIIYIVQMTTYLLIFNLSLSFLAWPMDLN